AIYMLARIAVRFCSTITRSIESVASSSTADAALHEVQSDRVREDNGTQPRRIRVKTLRYAMLMGYQGKNYFGMQVRGRYGSEDWPTIESHVLNAMLELKWITPELRQSPFDFYFQRASRTDRRVSAVRQLVSMQMDEALDLPSRGAELINGKLPDDIRVFGFRRVTKNFQAQKTCDRRAYSYTLPTYAFAKPTELTNNSFRISESTLAEINQVLSQYAGTHNFYNYTSKKSFKERSCKRYIVSFEVGRPFIFKDDVRNEEMEFVTCTVKGASFMLHQIRKMIGMAISIVREMQHPSALEKSFHSSDRIDIPKAPGLGLLLERLHYDWYDKNLPTHADFLPLTNWGEEVETAIEKLKKEQIVSEIMQTEIATQSMMSWLVDMNHHDFLDPTSEGTETTPFVTGAAKTAKEAFLSASAERNEDVKGESEEEERPEVEAVAAPGEQEAAGLR
ncbi:hypothetical protein PMAYCL1PPCAC_11270, partial [Pristionchus mayeri]